VFRGYQLQGQYPKLFGSFIFLAFHSRQNMLEFSSQEEQAPKEKQVCTGEQIVMSNYFCDGTTPLILSLWD
jgi:hypothetical protein